MMPVLFDFHGAGGNAHNYGTRCDGDGRTLSFYGQRHGFAVVGGEALQFGGGPVPPVPADCVHCFNKFGCQPGASCRACMKAHEFGRSGCASVCGPEHVPFAAAVAAVCGEGEVEEKLEEEDDTKATAWNASEWVAGWHGGQWLIPEVQTDARGIDCSNSTSVDVGYISNALAALAAYDEGGVSFNVSSTFFTGCSMGSAMTVWIAQCMHQAHPHAVTAFASQSTGLKTKGDGLTLPPDNYHPQYAWGECPRCEYFPAPVVPVGDRLKACIVDQFEDIRPDGEFYLSSLELNASWHRAGMRADIDLHAGGHCQTRSFEWIVTCLDDSSGRLLRGVRQ